MLDFILILLMGLLGYEGAGWWVILLGAVALTFSLWLQLYEMLRSGQPVRLDWQGVSYVTASFATNITTCSASYLVGYFGYLATK